MLRSTLRGSLRMSIRISREERMREREWKLQLDIVFEQMNSTRKQF